VAAPQLLSASRIREARNRAKVLRRPVWLSDDVGVRGTGRLLLRVMPNGQARFYFRSSITKQRNTRPLGVYSRVQVEGYQTIEQARTAARELNILPQRTHAGSQRSLRDGATVPVPPNTHEQQTTAPPHAAGLSVRDVCESYLAKLAQKGTQGSKTTARHYEALFAKYVYGSPVAELGAAAASTEDFVDILRVVLRDSTEQTARVLRAAMHAAYNLALNASSDPTQPKRPIEHRVPFNPITAIKKTGTPNARDRSLSNHDLYYFWRMINANGQHCTDVAIRMLRLNVLIGGQRCTQLLRVQLSEVDLSAGTILLYDEKGRRDKPRLHKLPLTSLAQVEATWLAEHARSAQSTHLFSGNRDGKCLCQFTVSNLTAEISDFLVTAKKIAEPFQYRDIRRTIETRLVDLDVHKDIRAQIQSHGLGGIQEKHYDRNDYMVQKRAALQKWAQHLTTLSSTVFGPEYEDDLGWLEKWQR
jgi:hypothetical protein